MRVMVNLLSSVPDKLTGISVYAWSQLRALLRHGAADYTLLTNWSQEAVAKEVPLDDLTLIEGRAPKSEKLTMLLGSYQVWRAARRANSDVVFTPAPLGPVFGGKARVNVVHDLYRDTNPHLFRADRRWTWSALFPLSLAATHRVVCVSRATQSDLERYHPSAAGRAVVVHEASTLRSKGHAGRPRAEPYALLVANAAPTKNLGRLLQALAELNDDDHVPSILWVGRDDSGDMARALAESPGCSKLIPIGQQSDSELATLYRHAEFLVVPSIAEGFCLPVLDAQGFGRPVVCSDIPVLREVAGHGARYFDPHDPGNIASAIGDISRSAELRAKLSAAAAQNASQFSWDRAAQELYAVFEEALSIATLNPTDKSNTTNEGETRR